MINYWLLWCQRTFSITDSLKHLCMNLECNLKKQNSNFKLFTYSMLRISLIVSSSIEFKMIRIKSQRLRVRIHQGIVIVHNNTLFTPICLQKKYSISLNYIDIKYIRQMSKYIFRFNRSNSSTCTFFYMHLYFESRDKSCLIFTTIFTLKVAQQLLRYFSTNVGQQ